MGLKDTAVDALRRMLGDSTSTKAQTFLNAVVAEEREIVEGRRKALMAERVQLQAKALAVAKAHVPVQAAAAERIENAQRELQAAIEAADQVRARHWNNRFPVEHRITLIDGELLTTASPQIEVFQKAMREEAHDVYDRRDSVRDQTIDGGSVERWSNWHSIERRALACREAARVVEALAFEDLDEAAIERRLAALREALPAVDPRPEKYAAFRSGFQYA